MGCARGKREFFEIDLQSTANTSDIVSLKRQEINGLQLWNFIE